MSWMITDQSDLRGTCYIELLPGKYANKCWNSASVYFTEEHFGFIEPTVIRHCPEYDHYAFTDIGRSKWQDIVDELEHLLNRISESTQLAEVEDTVDLFFTTTKKTFLQSETENMDKLRTMLIEFISWIRKTLESQDWITVLGI